ncbi:MAG: phosphatidylserine decarboxylase family protein [Bacteroidales bacterium]
MKLHKEGYTSVIISTILILAAITVIQIVSPVFHWLHIVLYVAMFTLWFIVLFFFREPQRDIKKDDKLILSPADGKIVVINEVNMKEYYNDKRIQVSVFMSPLDVHMNLIPFSGLVKYFKYYPGKYLFAWAPKSSEINERTSIVIEKDEKRNALVRQIAGAVARRVVCYSTAGKEVEQGEQLGFIKFGSRVDMFLPVDTIINVKLGQKVTGGKTIIGEWS